MVKIFRTAGVVVGALIVIYSLLHIVGLVPDFKMETGPFGWRLARSVPPMIYGLLLMVPCRTLTTRKRFLLYFIPLSIFTAIILLMGASVITLSTSNGANPLPLLFGLAVIAAAVANLWACFEVHIKVKW